MEDYIPTKEADFVEWSGNLIAVSKTNSTVWDLPDVQVTELETLRTQFKALHEKCQTPAHTALDTQEKNERKALGIPIHDQKPTPHPLPDSHPVITVESKNPFELILHIHDSASGKRAKPEHTNGAVLFWEVSKKPITNTQDFKTSLLITRTPHRMNFSPVDRGKILYMAGQWQNRTGEKGPWSEVVSAVIP
ncbi:MAG: hypothetical protein LBD93_10745 [Treponema sp.]|jgi:hypothetical protein|nr:hypothetical protein [Treponema sp.]